MAHNLRQSVSFNIAVAQQSSSAIVNYISSIIVIPAEVEIHIYQKYEAIVKVFKASLPLENPINAVTLAVKIGIKRLLWLFTSKRLSFSHNIAFFPPSIFVNLSVFDTLGFLNIKDRANHQEY